MIHEGNFDATHRALVRYRLLAEVLEDTTTDTTDMGDVSTGQIVSGNDFLEYYFG